MLIFLLFTRCSVTAASSHVVAASLASSILWNVELASGVDGVEKTRRLFSSKQDVFVFVTSVI